MDDVMVYNESNSLRQSSPVISSFPWVSGGIKDEDLEDVMGDFQPFLEHIQAFEAKFAYHKERQTITLRAALAYHPGHNLNNGNLDGVLVGQKKAIKEMVVDDEEYLCSLICLYRLLDVIAYVQKDVEDPTRRIFEKPATHWSKLLNWPTLLLDFRKTITRKLNDESSAPSGQSPLLFQLKNLLSLITFRKENNIYTNIQVAALHIACILGGHSQAVVRPPDFPAQGENIVTLISTFDPEVAACPDLEVITNHFKAQLSTARGMQFPLQLALLITPLYTIMPVALIKIHWKKMELLSLAKTMGNHKPAILLRVERIIWSSLFDIALGKRSVFMAVHDMITNLPWTEIEKLSTSLSDPDSTVRTWFPPDTDEPHPDTDETQRFQFFEPAKDHISQGPGLTIQAENSPSESETNKAALLPGSPTPSVASQHLPTLPVIEEEDVRHDIVPDGPQHANNSEGLESQTDHAGPQELVPSGDHNPPAHTTNSTAPSEPGEQGSAGNDCETLVMPPTMPDMMAAEDLQLGMEVEKNVVGGGCSMDQSISIPEDQHMADIGNGPDDDEFSNVYLKSFIGAFNKAAAVPQSTIDPALLSQPIPSRPETASQPQQPQHCEEQFDEDEEDADNTKEEIAGTISTTRSSQHGHAKGPTTRTTKGKKRNRLTDLEDEDQGEEEEEDDEHNDDVDRSPKKPRRNHHSRKGDIRTPRKKTRSNHLNKLRPITPSPGYAWNPIDVDAWSAVDVDEFFSNEKKRTLSSSPSQPIAHDERTLKAFDVEGNEVTIRPKLHVKEHLESLLRFGRVLPEEPLHITNPKKSGFMVYKPENFKSLTATLSQAALRKQCIVIPEGSQNLVNFDEIGLRTLSPSLTDVVTIQDQSINPGSYYGIRSMEGTLQDLLQAKRNGNHVLNALSFPFKDVAVPYSSFSTDTISWKNTNTRPGTPEHFPLGSMVWGLCGTTGAIHFNHLDPEGFGTVIKPGCGSKLWMTASPIRDDVPPFSSIDLFTGPKYEVEEPCTELWRWNAIVLNAGDVLIMPPNTPHVVYTIEHSVCFGGHFYATQTMQRTLFAIVHTFISDELLTNSEHPSSRGLLRAIMCFYYDCLITKRISLSEHDLGHVPDLETFQSLMDLVSLLMLIILLNALDPRTYMLQGKIKNPSNSIAEDFSDGAEHYEEEQRKVFDLNAIPFQERDSYCFSRGQCAATIEWLTRNYEITGPTGSVVDFQKDICAHYLASLVTSIQRYKELAQAANIPSGVSSQDLHCQLIAAYEWFCKTFTVAHDLTPPTSTTMTLAWPGSIDYTIRKIENLQEECDVDEKTFLERGTTAYDVKFKHGQRLGWDLTMLERE